MPPHDPGPIGPPPSKPPVPLPAQLDLAQLRRRAKELRRAVLAGLPQALSAVRSYHPHGEAAVRPDAIASFALRDAQATLARTHGFPGWYDLVQAVGSRRVEERGMHRWFGVEFHNEVWDLLGPDSLDAGISPESPQSDRDLVLYSAYASLRHWLDAGNAAHHARGEHTVARAALAVGLPDVGLRHARRCLDLIEANPDVVEDWDAPFAHEALARALAATGDLEGGRLHRAEAMRLTAAVTDPEDRQILETELARGPWFGLS